MADPYERKLILKDFYQSKREIKLKLVVVLDGYLDNRGLELIKPISRAFPKGTIIELICTDEKDTGPGKTVNKIAYVGFAELMDGGVLLQGDKIILNGKLIAEITGFDDTHMPNHQNTIIYMEKRVSGKDLRIKINDELIIEGFNKYFK